MVSQRVQRRIERWNTLAHAGGGVVALGVAGKSAASLGVVVLLAGLVTSTGVILTGVGIALLGFAAWWGSARTITARVDLSHGRAMWLVWCIPTWSVLGDLFDAF